MNKRVKNMRDALLGLIARGTTALKEFNVNGVDISEVEKENPHVAKQVPRKLFTMEESRKNRAKKLARIPLESRLKHIDGYEPWMLNWIVFDEKDGYFYSYEPDNDILCKSRYIQLVVDSFKYSTFGEVELN